jgi:hypothetical protein
MHCLIKRTAKPGITDERDTLFQLGVLEEPFHLGNSASATAPAVLMKRDSGIPNANLKLLDV